MNGRKLSTEEIREYLRFEILICNLESAYYLYKDQSRAFKRRRWEAWNRYIRDWCGLPWFQAHWSPEFTAYFDTDFSAHVSRIMSDVRAEQAGAWSNTACTRRRLLNCEAPWVMR